MTSWALERLALWKDARRGDPGAGILRMSPGTEGHKQYEQLRSQGDLVVSRRGLVFTASYRVIKEVLADNNFGAAKIGASRRHRTIQSDDFVHPLDDGFASLDPPRHTELRALANPAFHRRHIPDLTQQIEKTVDRCLDELPTTGITDLIAKFAGAVPLATITDILGLPYQHAPQFASWAKLLASLMDGTRYAREKRQSDRVVTEMTAYLKNHIHTVGPDDAGLVASLKWHSPTQLSLHDIIATTSMLLVGGYATTTSLIGNTLNTLLHQPHLHPINSDYSTLLEESLRFNAPIQYIVRISRKSTMLAGHNITRGTPVVLLLAAANRDPEIFIDPHIFDPNRTNPHRHLAFGAGIHVCLGAALTRAEAAIAVCHFFERYPNAQPAGDPIRLKSRVLYGLDRLPVVLGRPA